MIGVGSEDLVRPRIEGATPSDDQQTIILRTETLCSFPLIVMRAAAASLVSVAKRKTSR